MEMAIRTRPWSRADLARLPDDGNRYEVLDGRLLVTPQAARDHQAVATRLAGVLMAYAEPRRIGWVVAPGAVLFGPNELQPDVQVIPGMRTRGSWEQSPTPILVAEVLSVATARRDFGPKLDAYRERAGIATVWIVDYERREITVADATGRRVERTTLVWQPASPTDALRLDVQAFFVEALGE
jgi:Uma2 family endonuclease